MKKSKVERTLRVGELIRRELAFILQKDFKDPRVGRVTLTKIKVSKDLSEAKIYFLADGSDSDHIKSAKVLNGAAGFLRSQLASHLSQFRIIPKPHFFYDEEEEQSERLSHLIDTLAPRQDRQGLS